MLAIDVMTTEIVSASPETPIGEIARLMLERHISAVPILDEKGQLTGIVTEGDLLRRWESGTERKRSQWIEAFVDAGALAAEYVKSHGRLAKDVMTRSVVTVDESTPLHKIADIFESRNIKRVPVMRESRLVGLISRANLLQALVTAERTTDKVDMDDRSIRAKLVGDLRKRPWRPRNIVVNNGVVHFWGEVHSEEERDALRLAAENIPGVRAVRDHTWYPDVFPTF